MSTPILLRAALAASLALAGCSMNAGSAALDGGAAGDPAGNAGNASVVACATRSGTFGCGAGVCSRAIQACTAGLCEWYGDVDPSCGPCPTCACLRGSAINVSTCEDDGRGGITYAVYAGVEGDPCRSDANCTNGACLGGACHCLPAGATLPSSAPDACCSGWAQAGVCTAQPGSPCTTRVSDCNGGTCTGGVCSCVGPGGYCNLDTDCCDGTTRCLAGQCQ